MRILIIEDERDLSLFLKKKLEEEGFVIDTAYDGEEGSYLARTNEYDLVMLDWTMPKRDGMAVCRDIRDAGKSLPILVLSVRSEIPDKLLLFSLGADDFVGKPFCLSELLARIRALLRRPGALVLDVLSFEDLRIDSRKQKAYRGKNEVYLTRKEFLLLEYFIKNAGLVLSRGLIMEHVWNVDTDPFSNTIEAHILNLRKKVDNGKKKLIHTIPGRGYKLDVRK